MSGTFLGEPLAPLPFPLDRVVRAEQLLDDIKNDVAAQLERDTIPQMIDELEESLVIIQLAVTALFELRGKLIAEAAKAVNHEA